jgi:hypothetical protein
MLALPTHSKIHLMFHMSYLKKVMGSNYKVQTNLSKLEQKGFIWIQLKVVLDTIEHQLHDCMIQDVLIQWKNIHQKDVTWELATILQQFSHLQC